MSNNPNIENSNYILEILQALAERLVALEKAIPHHTPAPKHYNSRFACTYLGISKSTLDKKCSQRIIRFTKIGKLRRFTIEDLDAYLSANVVRTDAEIDDEAEMMLFKQSHRLMQKAMKS